MNPADDSSFDKTLGEQAYAMGLSQGHASSAQALPVGFRLGELRVERVLGEGGFGIVYLATDVQLGRQVALKEYMPGSMASRASDQSVSVRSERDRTTFDLGLRSFVNEARLLAQLDHPSLVKVHRFWEERGTAYMVMPYYQGLTLKQTMRGHAEPDEAWLRSLLEPLLDVLAYLHSQNIYHRDVSPDNILLLPDGRPVLLDFGAARLIIGDATQNLTAILKPGYAPVEQYAESASTRQGAWTDLYALAAVLYFLISGKAPTPSVARLVNDDLPAAATVGEGRFSRVLLEWIDVCLAVRPEQRPRDMAAAWRLLNGEAARPDPTGIETEVRSNAESSPDFAVPTHSPAAKQAPDASGPTKDAAAQVESVATTSNPRMMKWAAVALAALLAVIALAWYASGSNPPPSSSAGPTPGATTTSPEGVTATPSSATAIEPATSGSPISPAPSSAPPAGMPAVPAPPDLAAPNSVAERPAASAPSVVTPAVPTLKALPAPPRAPRNESNPQAAPCADLLQRLSLGEDNAALRQKLASLRCQ